MKTIKVILIALLISCFGFGLYAQKTISLRVIDDTPSVPTAYSADISLIWYNNGTYQPVGQTQTISSITPNITNDFSLHWDLPEDTENNCYILYVIIWESTNQNGPYYSAWFNSPTYYNNKIPVSATL